MKTEIGKCSVFGGPADTGMTIHEGLALVEPNDLVNPELQKLFILPVNLDRGLGRQLNPLSFYCAMRWDYALHGGRVATRNMKVLVRSVNREVIVIPVDWGPNIRTGRIIDLSPGAAKFLGVVTDDTVTVEIG